ncbi:MAG: ATP-binding protein, partial [Planctomycetaceae bacterium]
SGGYPYFIQFICREVYDVALQMHRVGKPLVASIADITRKLDTEFFAGRWARATDRQRELLRVVAHLNNCDEEFTVQEVVEKSKEMLQNSFGSSHVNQMFGTLSSAGLIYKNRHGKYSFAVPLLGQFIRRQEVGRIA